MDEKFTKIITDFTTDLLLTLPELKSNIDKINSDLQKTYDHCIEMYPKIFFEILSYTLQKIVGSLFTTLISFSILLLVINHFHLHLDLFKVVFNH